MRGGNSTIGYGNFAGFHFLADQLRLPGATTRLAAVTTDLGNISTHGELSVSKSNKKGKPNAKVNVAVLLVASTIPVMAQTNMKPANHDANTPAVNTPNTPPNPGAPVAGANSFTEGQAKSRIESKGFKSVSNLKKDDAGVWRGQAMQNDKTVSVSVDFQGNVVAQ